ncbi:MAG TPA: hypothetical protein VF721_18290 [Pyrinomonadaceae bacterium]
MSILIYWKYDNYIRDNAHGFGYNFNSNQSRLHTTTQIGDDVFVVGGIKRQSGLEIYLLAHLIIKEKIFNPPNYIYGRYRIEAEQKKSRYFSLNAEPITPYLSELTSIKHFDENQTHKYAQAFQTIRVLNEADTQRLKEIAKNLPLNAKTQND